MIIFRSIHHVYEYKICAPDYFIINIYNSTVSAGAIAIAHNDNNNINFNTGPTNFYIDHGNQPTYYYDSHVMVEAG